MIRNPLDQFALSARQTPASPEGGGRLAAHARAGRWSRSLSDRFAVEVKSVCRSALHSELFRWIRHAPRSCAHAYTDRARAKACAAASRRIGSACGGKGCARSKSGCPMSVPLPSKPRPTANLSPSPAARKSERIRTLSTASRSWVPDETRRDLDPRGRQGSCGQAASGGDLAGRSVRCDRIRHDLRFHDEPHRCAIVSPTNSAERNQWTAHTLSTDGGQDNDCVENEDWNSG